MLNRWGLHFIGRGLEGEGVGATTGNRDAPSSPKGFEVGMIPTDKPITATEVARRLEEKRLEPAPRFPEVEALLAWVQARLDKL